MSLQVCNKHGQLIPETATVKGMGSTTGCTAGSLLERRDKVPPQIFLLTNWLFPEGASQQAEEGAKLRSSERIPKGAESEGRDCLLIVAHNARPVQKLQIMQI